jgi:hypothetical protein
LQAVGDIRVVKRKGGGEDSRAAELAVAGDGTPAKDALSPPAVVVVNRQMP